MKIFFLLQSASFLAASAAAQDQPLLFGPLEKYPLTSCAYNRLVPSLNNETEKGPLSSIHPEHLWCDSGSGMRLTPNVTANDGPPLLESNHSLIPNRRGYISFDGNNRTSSGVAISTWFLPATENFHQIQPILTYGRSEYVQRNNLVTGCGFDIQIAQYQDWITIQFSDSDVICRTLVVRQHNLTADAVIHVIAVWSGHDMDVYINGESIFPNKIPIDFDLTRYRWFDPGRTVQLFSNYQSDVVFRGSIQQVSIFDRFLSASQVKAIHEEGVIYVEPPEIVLFAKEQDKVPAIHQDAVEPVTLQIGALNTSSPFLRLAYHVTSAPSHGVLSIDGKEIGDKGLIPLPLGTMYVEMNYTLKSFDYFNVPSVTAYNTNLGLEPETLDVRLVALDARSQVIGASTTVTHYIHAVHVNHRPQLRVPDEATRSAADPMQAGVFGIDFSDPLDFNLDRVRVDVRANIGLLTLQEEHRDLADFDSCRRRDYSAWQCGGTGYRNRRMIFVAIPDDIPFIFRNLGYESLKPGAEDEIMINIYDGSGGMCLDEREHLVHSSALGGNFTSVRNGCFHIQKNITVTGYEVKNGIPGGESSGLLGFSGGLSSTADFIFWSCVLLILLCCTICCKLVCPSCLARGRAIVPE